MLRYKVIVNPISGRGGAELAIPRIEQLLTDLGVKFDLVRTERPWHAADLAEAAAADGYDVVVTGSGDGTANEVLNGLMRVKRAGGQPPAMGFLSIGRGNDFSYGMGIPANLEEDCRVLAANHRRTVDVGRVVGGLYPQGRYFGNGVGIGFDAVVGFEALKLTWLSGYPSYLVAVLKTVFLYYKAPRVTIEYEGGDALELRTLMISIMNGQRMGGGFYMAPEGLIDDGLFDLCIAREVSRARIFSLIPHFMKGTQATQEPISMIRTRRLTVTALEGVLPAHADGETLCTDGKRLEIELLPRQIEMLTRPPEAG